MPNSSRLVDILKSIVVVKSIPLIKAFLFPPLFEIRVDSVISFQNRVEI